MQVAVEETTEVMPLLRHGALQLPCVRIESYNLELRDQSGFIGDVPTVFALPIAGLQTQHAARAA
jgi:hypothetical protein